MRGRVLIEELGTAVRNSFAARGAVPEVGMVPCDDDHVDGFRPRCAAPKAVSGGSNAPPGACPAGSFGRRCLEPVPGADAEAG